MSAAAPLLRRVPTTPADQAAIDARFARIAAAERLLSVKVTPFFARKIAAEVAALGHTEGPLHRIAHPTRERLELRAPGEVRDWVDDRDNMPGGSKGGPDGPDGPDAPGDAGTASGSIVQKYADRVLFMPTSTCAGHCQYCFRQDVLSEWHSGGTRALDAAVAELQDHLARHPDAREVILSGGDPMVLPTAALARVLRPLAANPQVTRLRVHTKTIAYAPAVYGDAGKLALLAECGVRLVFHLAHPYELCDVVTGAIARARAAGIRCYNQFPLLRHINDDAGLLAHHLETLDELEVRNLSVFVPEPIVGSAPFRLSWDRFETLVDALVRTTPSWINATRFVLDTPVGKVRREDLSERDRAAGTLTFERDGRRIAYPDFPAHLDEPGDPEVMLWRGRGS